jgi:hypothetical protein
VYGTKKGILKAEIYKGKPIRIIADFWAEPLKPKREWNDVF